MRKIWQEKNHTFFLLFVERESRVIVDQYIHGLLLLTSNHVKMRHAKQIYIQIRKTNKVKHVTQ